MRKFVRRWKSEAGPKAEPRADPEAGPNGPRMKRGRRLYCVGDIHGRLDLLRELHQMIAADGENSDGGRTLVYLGDYIDRGPESRGVIDELLDRPLPGFDTVYLLGNHEQTLLDFLEYPKQAAGWLMWGGRETLRSYGVTTSLDYMGDDMERVRDRFRANLPGRHLDFYRNMKLTYVAGDYLFVHAGIRPGVPLQDQRESDLLWIRNEFIDSQEQHSHVVVHGHTISEEVEIRPNRIGIDTGAFYSGVLTALVLEGTEQRLIQTSGRSEPY